MGSLERTEKNSLSNLKPKSSVDIPCQQEGPFEQTQASLLTHQSQQISNLRKYFLNCGSLITVYFSFASDFPPQEIPATVVPLSQVPSEVFVAVTWRTLGPFEFLRPKIKLS